MGEEDRGHRLVLERAERPQPSTPTPTPVSTLAPLVEAGEPARLDVAKLAHELRTPLAAIAALAEMIRDERLGPLGSARYREYAADIHDSAAHANTVLAALLDPAAGSRGAGGPMEFAEVAIGPLVASAVSALTPVADRAGVALAARIGDGLPHVIADRRSVRQILNNLIANALHFTPPGGTVTVALAYAAGGAVTIEVADSGDGMTPGELERARSGVGPEALRGRSGGTGIGLPLVRALAAANGATLSLDSALCQGTRAAVAFPHDRVVLL